MWLKDLPKHMFIRRKLETEPPHIVRHDLFLDERTCLVPAGRVREEDGGVGANGRVEPVSIAAGQARSNGSLTP